MHDRIEQLPNQPERAHPVVNSCRRSISHCEFDPHRGRMARHLETLAGIGDLRTVNLEDGNVLVEIIADQQILSVRREAESPPRAGPTRAETGPIMGLRQLGGMRKWCYVQKRGRA